MSDTQITTRPAFAIESFEDMERAAQAVAVSGMFGIVKKEQAMCLFMICQAEGINPMMALRRYHLIDGRPAMRADFMQGDFFARGGGIAWHIRAKDMACATFYRDAKKIDDAARKRGSDRFKLLWKLEFEKDPKARGGLMGTLADLSMDGEETILRTYADFEERGVTEGKNGTKDNWRKFAAEMLTARVASAGIRVVDPGLIAGVSSPEELEDAGLTQLDPQKRATGDPGARDRSAMESMRVQYLEDAKETKSPARKSELLGLASDLKIKMEEMDAKSEPPPELKDDAINMTPAPIPQSVPNEAGDLELLPATKEEERVPWADYVLQKVTSKTLIGRRLGDFSKAELKVIFEKTYKSLNDEDPAIRMEAAYIKEGYDSWREVEKAEMEEKE